MRKIFFVLLPLAFLACNNQNTAQQTAKNTDGTATQTAASDENTNIEANGEVLTLSAPELTAKSGETVCVDVLVKDFNKLLSMQYTITWNKNVLTFKELKNFKLPYLDVNDFGMNHTQNGALTIAWIDESLKGL